MSIGENLAWETGIGTLHGKPVPRAVASTPDARTTIEIIGKPGQVKQIVVVGQMIDEATAVQAAQYMAIAMRIVLPQWAGVDAWLAESLRQVKRKPQSIRMHGWRIGMRWIPELSTVALQASH